MTSKSFHAVLYVGIALSLLALAGCSLNIG